MTPDTMQVECHHHIDAGEQDAEGFYDYYYEYDLYHFSLGGFRLVVRSYSDTSTEASLLRLEAAGKVQKLQYKDLARPVVQQAVAYLHQQGKLRIRWFNPQSARYESV